MIKLSFIMYIDIIPQVQCIGSGSGSGTVGSATFWQSGSVEQQNLWIHGSGFKKRNIKQKLFKR